VPAPAPARRPAPKDPPTAPGDRIERALSALFTAGGAAREGARAALVAGVEEWSGAVKDDPLRAVDWWRGALERTLPTALPKKSRIFDEKFPYLPEKETTLTISLPPNYTPGKQAYPLVLTLLDKGLDAKRVLPLQWGDLLKEWIVVCVSADPRVAGFDVSKEPWLAAVGLKYAIEHFRVDRDRVVLDGLGSTGGIALTFGAEAAVHFAGCILRAPTASSPVAQNLNLGSTLVLAPRSPSGPVAKGFQDLRAAVPGLTLIEADDAGASFESAAAQVQAWVKALPKRRISNPATESFTWWTMPQGTEVWAYWAWHFRAVEDKPERLVKITLKRDAAANAVDIQSENLAEGLLLLNDAVADLDRDLTVRVNGTVVWGPAKPERKLDTLLYWIGQTGERTLFVPAEVRFVVPASAQSPGGAPKPGNAPPAPPK